MSPAVYRAICIHFEECICEPIGIGCELNRSRFSIGHWLTRPFGNVLFGETMNELRERLALLQFRQFISAHFLAAVYFVCLCLHLCGGWRLKLSGGRVKATGSNCVRHWLSAQCEHGIQRRESAPRPMGGLRQRKNPTRRQVQRRAAMQLRVRSGM